MADRGAKMGVEMQEALCEALRRLPGDTKVTINAPMSRYTTLRLGGPADILCDVGSTESLGQALALAGENQTPVTLLGGGSNLLVRDGGIRGLVIRVGGGMSRVLPPVPLADGRVALAAEAGATLARLSGAAAACGLAGLEFAAGIPGTVGGAVFMNAGAFGGEMKDVVTTVTGFTMLGRPVCWSGEEMAFGYRESCLSRGGEAAVATVTVALPRDNAEAIRTAMRDFSARRREKQPLSQPSCGSTFKRPQGYFAGALIEQCGLKGIRIGGASVSQLHAGFLLNDGEGSAADYLALIAHVQQVVMERTGVWLEPEVRVLGEDAPAMQ